MATCKKFAKLRGRIREMFGTQAEFATVIGISESALTARLTGTTGWSFDEVVKACKALDLTHDQAFIFFDA